MSSRVEAADRLVEADADRDPRVVNVPPTEPRPAGGQLVLRVTKGKPVDHKGRKTKPWVAQIGVTVDGKQRNIGIGTFAREEDAARAFDRVNIAKLGHAKAKTNFPVVKYRAEWAELEALGTGAAVARKRQRARQD